MTSDATTYITTNTLLSSSYAYLDEVVVDNNAILTITGASTVVSFRNNVTIKPGSKLMINMGATAKLTQRIFLENATSQSNGAELQVDGATLKAYNSSGWRGIEVWGAATYEKKA